MSVADARWIFGVEPLPQTVEAAGLLRRVTELVLTLEGEDEAVDNLISCLRGAEARLAALGPVDLRPRVGPAVESEGRVYLDHARDVGAFNPCIPAYTMAVDGNVASGTVNFPIVYEGPPGLVHGGVLSLFFDCVIQQHNCDVGVAGKTTALAVRYRRPTPLLTPLAFDIERAVDGDRITSTGRLLLDGQVLCEAEVRTVVGNRAALPAVSPRRSGP
jgi:hypothetical protein